ncbi:sugar transferase [Candidatus Uhrbacteria bacterium]|nr:sugar transferase [Candidatus Uhrbacteria bacterium]
MIFLLLLSDILTLAVAFSVSYILRTTGLFSLYLQDIQPLQTYLIALPVGITLLIIVFTLRGLYRPKKRLTQLGELYETVTAINLWFLLVMSGSYLAKFDYSRIIIVLFWVFSMLFVTLGRSVVRALHAWHIRNGRHRTNILIVGAGRPGKQIYEQLQEYASVGYHIVGFVDNTANHPLVLGNIQQLSHLIVTRNIDQVYIADPSLSDQAILSLVNDCPKRDVEFKVATNVFELLSEIRGGLYLIDRIPTLNLSRSTPGFLYRWSKRTIDLIMASILLLLTLPLWAIIAILIKRDSTGPVFLLQQRVGFHGQPFTMFKFRTMIQEAALYKEAPQSTADQRITRIGAPLRRMSLDELPQLINILKGEMSLVGPRPEMPFLVERYSPWQRKRLSVKPGLTGLWQILGRKNIPLSENLEYDFFYINNQSILLDLLIVLKTIPQIIRRKGAF